MSLFDSSKKITDYTKQEFIQLMIDMLAFDRLDLDDEALDEHVDSFIDYFKRVTEHPRGSDVIFYPNLLGIEDNEAAMVEEVIRWRQSQGLPCFKDE